MVKRSSTDYRVVHGAWTPPHLDVGAEEIDRWHRERGWNGIGYHYVIRRDGTLEEGRGIEEVGAHVGGYNAVSIGYALIGGKPEDGEGWDFNYTRPQLRMLLIILQQHGKLWPDSRVLGHRDFPGVSKNCPGFNVAEWYGDGDEAVFEPRLVR